MAVEPEAQVAVLLATAWVLERLCTLAGASPLLGNLFAGIALGPALSDWFPFVPAFQALGTLGVMLLVLESGLFATPTASSTAQALLLATTGVVCPVLLVLGLGTLTLGYSPSQSLAVGAALAPTSLGFTAHLLKEAGLLHTDRGRLISTAAVIDDVLALYLLAQLSVSGQAGLAALRPALASLGSLVVAGGLYSIVRHYHSRCQALVESVSDSILLLSLFLLSGLLATLSASIGSSSLLGCYLTGLCFSTLPRVSALWTQHLPVPVDWGLRVFFTATIGFGVPSLTEHWSRAALGQAVVLALAGVLGKLCVGLVARDKVVGLAMNGRGEFSFLLADRAFARGAITRDQFVAVIAALLLICLVLPFVFRSTVSGQVQPTEEIELCQE